MDFFFRPFRNSLYTEKITITTRIHRMNWMIERRSKAMNTSRLLAQSHGRGSLSRRGAGLNPRHRGLRLALLGALVGLVAFLCIHTAASLNVTYDAWILDGYVEKDILQHYTGWLFYRSAPLAFPLGISPAMQYPSGTAVTFTDSVPLLAIFFRFFSAWLPQTFQYFGWFSLFCYMAQGAGAALLLGLFLPQGVAGELSAVMGSGLFVTYPILVERTFRHTALAAQCFIVFALYLYFRDRRAAEEVRSRFLPVSAAWFALTTLSAAIHPYFVPMVYALLFADLLTSAAETAPGTRGRAWTRAALTLALHGAATLAVLYGIGAFSSPASEGISGYSYFCLNLNALYNPVSRGAAQNIVWSRALPTLEQGLGTYDGFNYMGLGVLLFGGVALLWALGREVSRFTRRHSSGAPSLGQRLRRHWALALVCVVLTVFAISNVLVWNGEVLFSLPIPGFLSRLGNIFRSSGRMLWPVSYLALTATVIFWARCGLTLKVHGKMMRTAPHWLGPCCVALLLAVQLWDISPALSEKRQAFTQPQAEFENPMQSELWDAAAGQYDHLFSLDDTLVQALWPALWSAQNGMTTNDGFTARFDFAAHRADVAQEVQRLLSGQVQSDTLYLTCDYPLFAEIADALLAANADVTCAQVDNIWYAIIPHREGMVLPAAGDEFSVYPALPLRLAPLTDAVWSDGVKNDDKRVCIFYAGDTANNAFANATQLLCEGAAYDILNVDTSDAGWVMVTLEIEDASVLAGHTLATR